MARRAGRATGKVSKSVIRLHDVRTLEGALVRWSFGSRLPFTIDSFEDERYGRRACRIGTPCELHVPTSLRVQVDDNA
jgi:hypothetical protein